MKKLKLRLDALREEMEILDFEELKSIKGGGEGGYYGYDSWEDFIAAAHNGDVEPGNYYPDGGYGEDGGYGYQVGGYGDPWGPWPWDESGGYGDYGDYGGYGDGDRSLDLILWVQDGYSEFYSNFSNILLVANDQQLPPGYTLDSTGTYLDSFGEPVYGVTYISGGHTYVHISPFIMGAGQEQAMSLIGHELLHAVHIEEHSALYQSNFAQFKLNSEYASYKFQYVLAHSRGQTAIAAECLSYMDALEDQCVDKTWRHSLVGF